MHDVNEHVVGANVEEVRDSSNVHARSEHLLRLQVPAAGITNIINKINRHKEERTDGQRFITLYLNSQRRRYAQKCERKHEGGEWKSGGWKSGGWKSGTTKDCGA